MSKPRAKRPEFADPVEGGRMFTGRFILALLVMALGIAWIIYYAVALRADPATGQPVKGNPQFLADLGGWNYAIGFILLFVGLLISAHPSTPLGRGRGVVVGMLGCFLIGLLWICTFYVMSDNLDAVPLMRDLGQKNLFVGIGFMAVGFAFATRWE